MKIKATDLQASGQGLPPGTIVKKGGKTVFEAGGRSYNCTIYNVDTDNMKMKTWHSPQLPPIFSGGNVKIETEAQGMKTTIILKGYTGAFIKP